MRWLFTRKSFRWLMAVSVSLWMAGAGCLFGCSNGATASAKTDTRQASSETVVAGGSCASMKSHDCCAKKNGAAPSPRSETSLPSLASLPQGMMEDCPLAVTATAVVSKAGTDKSNVALTRTAWSSQVITSNTSSPTEVVSSIPPNRGPTYLRCCVFLI